jgi:RNA polymerase sigma factor (sigma-70 family)
MSENQAPRLRLVGDAEPAGAAVDEPAGASRRPASPEESGTHGPANFADAFRRHYALVHRMLRTYGVDEALLDDAAQEVFLVVHRRWGDYDGRRAFRSWLIGITRKVASSYRRAGRRLRARLDKLAPPPQPASPELRLAQREQLARVEAFITQLPTRQREVFVLAEIEGMSAPEIAEIVGAKLNTVYSRLRVARERFAAWRGRERLRQDEEGGSRVRTRR